MTAPTWADRSRPVAERVELAMLDFSMDDATEAYRRELVADVAAAVRLARATAAWIDAADDFGVRLIDVEPKEVAMNTAHIAYRARMQGVGDG